MGGVISLMGYHEEYANHSDDDTYAQAKRLPQRPNQYCIYKQTTRNDNWLYFEEDLKNNHIETISFYDTESPPALRNRLYIALKNNRSLKHCTLTNAHVTGTLSHDIDSLTGHSTLQSLTIAKYDNFDNHPIPDIDNQLIQSLSNLLDNTPTLTELTIRDANIGTSRVSLLPLCKSIAASNTLKKLTLTGIDFTTDNFQALITAIICNPSITSIHYNVEYQGDGDTFALQDNLLIQKAMTFKVQHPAMARQLRFLLLDKDSHFDFSSFAVDKCLINPDTLYPSVIKLLTQQYKKFAEELDKEYQNLLPPALPVPTFKQKLKRNILTFFKEKKDEEHHKTDIVNTNTHKR